MGDIRASAEDTARPVPSTAHPTEHEVTVLVTGFGPFLKQFPINPSHEIAKSLPPTLTLTTPSTSTTTTTTTTHITITQPPHPLTVAYAPTHAAIPPLLSRTAPDLVLHIGLAAGRSYYAIERSSAKHGYDRNADVDGAVWTRAASDAAWPAAPDRLETGLGFEGVWRAWRDGCARVAGVVVGGSDGQVRRGRGVGVGGEGMDGVPSSPAEVGVGVGVGGLVRREWRAVEVRPSDDVGSYLCGFIYWNSLAWFWEKEREEAAAREAAVGRPVLFLHVPACPEERDVERGRAITVELIKAMVTTWLAQREKAGAR